MAYVDPSNIPQNSLMPIPQSLAEWNQYQVTRTRQAAAQALANYQASPAPTSSFSSLGQQIMTEVGNEVQQVTNLLLNRSSALQAPATYAAQTGAVITDDQIASAPTVVPMTTVPSMLPPNQNTIAAAQKRVHIRRQPGTPWGVSPSSTPNVCEPGAPAGFGPTGANSGNGFLSSLQGLSPWAALFLVAGLGAVVYNSAKD